MPLHKTKQHQPYNIWTIHKSAEIIQKLSDLGVSEYITGLYVIGSGRVRWTILSELRSVTKCVMNQIES